MKKVMVFGTFDLLHKGHEYFLQEAKRFGIHLIVVVGLDETILEIKGKKPHNPQNLRVKNLLDLEIVDEVVLGNKEDKLKVIEDNNPDILVFGYDQNSFNIGIEEKLTKRNLNIQIEIISNSYFPNKFKSSIIREKLKI